MTRFGTRRNRRLHVLLYALALVFLYPLMYEYLRAFAVLVFLLVSPLYYARSALITSYWKDQMDERERQAVLEGYKLTYAVLVSTLLVSLLAGEYPTSGWLAGVAPYFLFTPDVLFDPLTLGLFALMLLVCVVAWLEPDPIPESPHERVLSGYR